MTLQPHNTQFLCSLLLCLALQPCWGQSGQRALSLKPSTDFDQRFYYSNGEKQNVWGYRIGVLVNEKFKLGLGGYYMNRSTDQVPVASQLARSIPVTNRFHKTLYLGTLYYEPFLLRRRLWEASLVFETGYGRTINYIEDKNDQAPIDKHNSVLVPAGAGLSLNFKPPVLFHLRCFRWIGINAMAGYRAAVYRQDRQFSYNGFYWSISGAIFLDKIVDDFRSWKKQKALRSKPATLRF